MIIRRRPTALLAALGMVALRAVAAPVQAVGSTPTPVMVARAATPETVQAPAASTPKITASPKATVVPSITGVVTRAGTKTTIAGIKITITEAYSPIATVTTRADGKYAFHGLVANQDYQLSFATAGALKAPAGGYVAVSHLEVRPSPLAPTVHNQALAVGAAFTGTVTSAQGRAALKGVDALVFTLNDGQLSTALGTARTGADGRYRISGLAPTAKGHVGYAVCFDGRHATPGAATTGYAQGCAGAAGTWNGGRPLPTGTAFTAVTSGKTTTVDARLTAAGAIAGTVSAAAGGGKVAGANLLVYTLADGNISTALSSATTGKNGAYRVTGLDPGTTYGVCFATMTLRTGPYLPQCWKGAAWDGDSTPKGAKGVRPKPGAVTTGIDAKLAAGGALHGTVLGADGGKGTPLRYAQVILEADDGSQDYAGSAVTAKDGTWWVGGLAAGSYQVCYYAGEGTTGGSYAGGYANDCTQTVKVVIGPAKTLTATLKRAAAVHGVVTSGGAPLSGVTVNSNFESATTNSKGAFTVADAGAGRQQFCFDASFASGGSSTTGYVAKCVTVTLTDGKITTLNVALTPGGVITGAVQTSAGTGLGNVVLHVFDSDDRDVTDQDFATSDDGGYRVGGLAAGTYQVCFDASNVSSAALPLGYQSQCFKAQPWNGNDVPAKAATVTVAAGKIVAHVDATLTSAAGLAGRVTNAAKHGIDDVEVSLLPAKGSDAVTQTNTDVSGAYSFSGVVPGTYRLCFEGDDTSDSSAPAGYADVCYNGVAWDGNGVPGGLTPVVLKAGVQTTVNATLTASPGISGTVRDTGGQPVSGANVEVIDRKGNTRSASTDSNGHYVVGVAGAGTYRVCVDASGVGAESTGGYQPICYKNTAWDGGEVPHGADPVVVGVGGVVTGIDVVVPGGGAIDGTVLGADGKPVSVSVYLFDADGTVVRQTSSDGNDGTYSLPGLAPGRYRVCFDNDYDGSTVIGTAVCYLGVPWIEGTPSAPAAGATAVSVTAGAVTSGIDARLGRPGTISGTVGPKAAGSADVRLYDSAGNYVSDEDVSAGAFSFPGLTAGSYLVCATPDDSSSYAPVCWKTAYWSGFDAPPSDATPVTVTGGATTSGIALTLPKLGGIAGTVTSAESGETVTNADVQAFTATGQSVQDANTIDGRYQFTGLVPGNYIVCVNPIGASSDSDSDSDGFAAECNGQPWDGTSTPTPGSNPVQVTPGATTRHNVALAAGGVVTGHVTAAGGAVLDNATVELFDASGDSYIEATTRADGGYALTGLDPGATYRVCVAGADASSGSDDGLGYLSACYPSAAWGGPDRADSGHAPLPAGAMTVTATSGGTTSGIDVTLQPAGAITGTITGPGNAAVSDATVSIFAGTRLVQQANTDDSGVYTAPGLPTGSYTVCVDGSSAIDTDGGLGYAGQCVGGVAWSPSSTAPASGSALVPVTVGSAATADATLSAGGALTGTISTSDKGDLDGVLYVLSSSGATVGQTYFSTTGGTTGFTVGSLPTGSDHVCVRSYGSYRSQCYSGKAWSGDTSHLPSGMTAVAVTQGSTSAAISVTLKPSA